MRIRDDDDEVWNYNCYDCSDVENWASWYYAIGHHHAWLPSRLTAEIRLWPFMSEVTVGATEEHTAGAGLDVVSGIDVASLEDEVVDSVFGQAFAVILAA
ncbi:hypothetical protein LTR62_006780 [Meristemomyces frigidus]|uniref:Uncharacterized protein n=1 Tax=Meristemomyces frigidus TaxID=1508187 RepID=A0AAN7TJL7_9PEZI|nr:hypothetical protein LTR62_006780 [Meristemomyces frigidus]